MISPILKGTRSEKIADMAKTGHTVINIFSLIKIIGGTILVSIILIFFMVLGLPWYIGTIGILIMIGLVIVQIIRLKRISSAKLR